MHTNIHTSLTYTQRERERERERERLDIADHTETCCQCHPATFINKIASDGSLPPRHAFKIMNAWLAIDYHLLNAYKNILQYNWYN